MGGLYLAVFDDDDELDGVEIGTYSDFSAFRNAVVKNLENDVAGSKYPTLILHSDCDGVWTPSEAALLEAELEVISQRFRELSPIPLSADWKEEVARILAIEPKSLYDCFFDVDGESLLERLLGLVRLSQAKNLPILFQ